jgi:preprotein translocase subunit SecG
LEIGESDLDERPDRFLETCLAREGERLLVRRAHLLRRDALLQTVVARDDQLLDPRARLVGHPWSVLPPPCTVATLACPMPWLQISAVLQVLLSAALVTLVLMHSGREAGMGGLGFTPHSQGGTHVVERNLTRLTVAIATVFGVNTILLFHLL